MSAKIPQRFIDAAGYYISMSDKLLMNHYEEHSPAFAVLNMNDNRFPVELLPPANKIVQVPRAELRIAEQIRTALRIRGNWPPEEILGKKPEKNGKKNSKKNKKGDEEEED